MVSKKLFSAVLATLVVLSIVGPIAAFAQTGNTVTTNATVNATKTGTAKATQTLAQTIANNTNLKNFTSLLKKANLTNVLNGPGNYTVFAPDDAAFSKVNASARSVDNAVVTTPYITATNGVVHIFESVMIPPPTTATASATAAPGFL